MIKGIASIIHSYSQEVVYSKVSEHLVIVDLAKMDGQIPRREANNGSAKSRA